MNAVLHLAHGQQDLHAQVVVTEKQTERVKDERRVDLLLRDILHGDGEKFFAFIVGQKSAAVIVDEGVQMTEGGQNTVRRFAGRLETYGPFTIVTLTSILSI